MKVPTTSVNQNVEQGVSEKLRFDIVLAAFQEKVKQRTKTNPSFEGDFELDELFEFRDSLVKKMENTDLCQEWCYMDVWLDILKAKKLYQSKKQEVRDRISKLKLSQNKK